MICLCSLFLGGLNNIQGQIPFYKKNEVSIDEPYGSGISCVYELANGNLLLGTNLGLKLFNGKNFKEIPIGEDNAVVSIIDYCKDSILLFCETKIIAFNYHNFGFKIKKNIHHTMGIVSTAIRAENQVYIGTTSGFYKSDFNFSNPVPLENKLRVHGIQMQTFRRFSQYDSKRKLLKYVCTDGVYIIHAPTDSVLHAFPERNMGHSFTMGESIIFKRQSDYFQLNPPYIQHSKTHVIIDQQTGFKVVKVLDNGCILKDKDGRYLFKSTNTATSVYFYVDSTFVKEPYFFCIQSKLNTKLFYFYNKNKLILLSPNFYQLQSVATLKEDIEDFDIITEGYSVLQDDSILYITNKKGDIMEIDLYRNYKRRIYRNTSPTQNKEEVGLIRKFGEDELVVFGNFYYVFFNKKTKLFEKRKIFKEDFENTIKTSHILDIHYNKKRILFSIRRKGLLVKESSNNNEYLFNGSEIGGFRTIRKIQQLNSEDEYMFGSHSYDGFYKYNFSTHKIDFFKIEELAKRQLNKPIILFIYKDGDAVLMGTINGLIQYSISQNRIIRHWNFPKGNNNFILFCTKTASGYLVADKDRLYALENNSVKQLQVADASEYILYLASKNGQPLVLTNYGLNALNLKPQKLNAYVTSALIHEKLNYFSSNVSVIQCKAGTTHVSLFFGCSLPEYFLRNGYFYYKINGAKSWTKTNDNAINLHGMSHGKYQIQYYFDNGSYQSEVKKVDLIISPFWYQTLWFKLALILLFLASIMVFYLNRLRSLATKKAKEMEISIAATEIERERLSTEFHDGIGPNLSALKLQLIKNQNENIADASEIADQLDHTISNFRNIIRNLSQHELKEMGLNFALNKYLSGMKTILAPIEIHYSSNLETMRLDYTVEVNLYRIVQELLNNAIKYSGCNMIVIDLMKQKETISLMFSDDGIGFNTSEEKLGFGLRNIKNRTAAIDGEFNLQSSPEFGTSVEVLIPIHL